MYVLIRVLAGLEEAGPLPRMCGGEADMEDSGGSYEKTDSANLNSGLSWEIRTWPAFGGPHGPYATLSLWPYRAAFSLQLFTALEY